MVKHKKYPQKLSRTHKRRMRRQKAADRRHLINVLVEIQKEVAMELDKVKEGMVPSLEKQCFGGKLLRIWSQ